MASEPQVYPDVPFGEGSYELRTSVPRNRKGKFYCRECHDFYDLADFSPYLRETTTGPRLAIMANCVTCRKKKLNASRDKSIAVRRQNAERRRQEAEDQQIRDAEAVLEDFDAAIASYAETAEETQSPAIDTFVEEVVEDIVTVTSQDVPVTLDDSLIDPFADVIIEDVSVDEPTPRHEDHVMQTMQTTTTTHQETARPSRKIIELAAWLDITNKPSRIQLFVARHFTVAHIPPAAGDERCYQLFTAEGGPGEMLSRTMLFYVLGLLYPDEILPVVDGELLS